MSLNDTTEDAFGCQKRGCPKKKPCQTRGTGGACRVTWVPQVLSRSDKIETTSGSVNIVSFDYLITDRHGGYAKDRFVVCGKAASGRDLRRLREPFQLVYDPCTRLKENCAFFAWIINSESSNLIIVCVLSFPTSLPAMVLNVGVCFNWSPSSFHSPSSIPPPG